MSTSGHGPDEIYEALDEMQVDLDSFLEDYNTRRSRLVLSMNERTPLKAFPDGQPNP